MSEASGVVRDSLQEFKTGVDQLLEKRDYFMKRILPKLVEGYDYYLIKGRRSLGKAGAEKLAAIFQLVATFRRDAETINSLQNVENVLAFVCDLRHKDQIVGQGRGATLLKTHNGDVNKAVKMSQKSSYIDAVIRTVGLSDVFSQDIEHMSESEVATLPERINSEAVTVEPDNSYFSRNQQQAEDQSITPKQKDLLIALVNERVSTVSERERWFAEIESCSKFDASEMISSFLMSSRR